MGPKKTVLGVKSMDRFGWMSGNGLYERKTVLIRNGLQGWIALF